MSPLAKGYSKMSVYGAPHRNMVRDAVLVTLVTTPQTSGNQTWDLDLCSNGVLMSEFEIHIVAPTVA